MDFGFIILKFSLLHSCECCHELVQPKSSENNFLSPYMGSDSFIKTYKLETGSLISDISDLQEKFSFNDFFNLMKNPELYAEKNENVLFI